MTFLPRDPPGQAIPIENKGGFLPLQYGIAPTERGTSPSSRLSDSIAQQLGVDIVCGLYAVGEALPTELTLASHWNVSRTAVREGLAILMCKGLIEARKKAGTLVTERSRWHLLDPLVLFWMRLADPNETFIRSLFELRLIIEPQAAGLAARRRTDHDLARLQKAFDIMSDGRQTEETARRAEIRFHRTIIEAADNPILLPLADSVEAAVVWTNSYKTRRNVSVRASVPDHQLILDAIRRKDDAEARWLTETLIRSTIEPSSAPLIAPETAGAKLPCHA